MKKVLFSTTALAAAGALAFGAQDAQAQSKAKKLSIGLGGFMKAFVSVSEQQGKFESTSNSTARVTYDAFNIYTDSEIYFRGTTKLDNGIGVTVTVQLEADQINGGGSIDESYLKLTGGFGDIRIGNTKKAQFVLKHRAPVVGPFPHDNGDHNNFIIRPANHNSVAYSTHVGGLDHMSFVYISPKIADAIRIGGSITPSTSSLNSVAAVGGNAGTESAVYDAIVSYESKIGSTSVQADIGYYEQHGTANNSFKGWRGGILLGFGGIGIGMGYKDQSDIDTGKGGTANSDEQTVYDIGVTFSSGPFKVGATYLHGEEPLASATTGDDELDKYVLGGQYNMGPGINLTGQFVYADWSNESTNDGNNNEGWAVIGGVTVSF